MKETTCIYDCQRLYTRFFLQAQLLRFSRFEPLLLKSAGLLNMSMLARETPFHPLGFPNQMPVEAQRVVTFSCSPGHLDLGQAQPPVHALSPSLIPRSVFFINLSRHAFVSRKIFLSLP